MDVTFTVSELESLLKSQLVILSEYYNLGISKREKKEVFVDALKEFYKISDSVVEFGTDRPQMSVRIRRIKEASNGA